MERFLAEDVSEQYAVFVVPTTGKLSIAKPCTCGANFSAGNELQEQEAGFIVDVMGDGEPTQEKDA
jgi:hypothetical protein